MDELLAKAATEPLTGGASCFSNVLVPKCTGSLQPLLNLKKIIYFMCISIFKMSTIRQVQKLFKKGHYAFLN